MRVSIRQAAPLLETSEQGVRELVKRNMIPGACCWGSKKHMTYYITTEQIERFKKGELYEKGHESQESN